MALLIEFKLHNGQKPIIVNLDNMIAMEHGREGSVKFRFLDQTTAEIAGDYEAVKKRIFEINAKGS